MPEVSLLYRVLSVLDECIMSWWPTLPGTRRLGFGGIGEKGMRGNLLATLIPFNYISNSTICEEIGVICSRANDRE